MNKLDSQLGNDLGVQLFERLNKRFDGNEQAANGVEVILGIRGVVAAVRSQLQKLMAEDFGKIAEVFPRAVEKIGKGRNQAKKVSVGGIVKNYANLELLKFLSDLESRGVSLVDDVERGGETVLVADEVVVPPANLDRDFQNGEAKNQINNVLKPRYELCRQLLDEMGVSVNDYVVYEGQVRKEMMRQEPYYQFVIPRLNRMVLVCEQYGNRTFVIKGSGEKVEEKYRKMDKEDLKASREVRHLEWNENTDEWKEVLRNLLELDCAYEISVLIDRAYYENPAYVKADLEAYAAAVGKDVLGLKISIIKSVEVKCANGESVKGGTYLKNASVKLGLTRNNVEANSMQGEILRELKKLAGYEVPEFERDRAYYENPEYVKADLEAYAATIGKNVLELNAKNISSVEVECVNGELVKGATYIGKAAIHLGLAKNAVEAGFKRVEVLKILKWIAGYEVVEFEKEVPEFERDEFYYENPAYVKADLEAYAAAVGKGVLELNPGSIQSVEVKCANGESVRGQTYIKNAAVQLGLAQNDVEANSLQGEVLNVLKWVAGYEVPEFERDRSYYENPEYVRADLEAYAAAVGKDVLGLKISNIKSVEVKCANGESVKGGTYLRNAAVQLGLVQNDVEASSKKGEVLQLLKDLAGN